MTASAEMPRYQCHKQVWALKIAAITHHENPDKSGCSAAASYGATITPAESGYDSFTVSAEFMVRHRPEVGGYYVVYDDGYASYSPAGAFEGGYRRILQPYQQRVVEEKADVDEKLAKLRAFTAQAGGVFDSLSTQEKWRLTEQLGYMARYSDVLGRRIAAFPA